MEEFEGKNGGIKKEYFGQVGTRIEMEEMSYTG